jgi:RHS repeat-associated protein
MSAPAKARLLALSVLLLASGCGRDQEKDRSAAPGEDYVPETACSDHADNDADGATDCEDADCRIEGSGCELAPALDRSVATTVWESAQFLFAGKDPVQKGAKADAFSRTRVALLRGRAVGLDGEALAGVRVSIAGQEQWGYTVTRPDGRFDLAVNGGSELLVQFAKPGHLSAERAVRPGWQSYVEVPEVGLVKQADTASAMVAEHDEEQVVEGAPVEDEFGGRQPVLVFPRDTKATAVKADGSEAALSELHVRVTEYPFDPPDSDGITPARFAPGTLPPDSASFGVEATVDEAQALGATEVQFSDNVSLIVENFMGLEVGSHLPLGYYRRGEGQWQDETAGRVVEVTDIQDGEANVDADGDGKPESHEDLQDLGFTHATRREMARRYLPGATLWHVPLTHFSPHIATIPIVAPANATAPALGTVSLRPLDVPTRRGPVLVERQALIQSFGIPATPFSFVYQSDRTPGYQQGYRIDLPIVPEVLPTGLKRIVASLRVAGRTLRQDLQPKVSLAAHFEWDGKDSFGRVVQGRQQAEVTVSYVYDGELRPSDSFGTAADVKVTSSAGTLEASLTRRYPLSIGTWDAGGYGFGGFSIDALHALDPASQTIYFGWGDERTAQNVALVVTRPAGTTALGTPDGVAVAPDGSVLVTDDQQDKDGAARLLRLSPKGAVTVVAGQGARGAAARMTMGSPQGVVVRGDGSVVFADFELDSVREVKPDGSVRTLIGPAGDRPVVTRRLSDLDGLALGNRGELYIVDGDQVWRFEGRRLSAFAGTGSAPSSNDVVAADGVSATQVALDTPSGVAVAPDGSVFVSEREGHRIRHIVNGIIRTVVGTGVAGFSGDGGSALTAQINEPRGLAVAADGSLYFADQGNNRIRRVTPDGIIQTIVGDGDASLAEGQLAQKVKLTEPDGIAIGADGALYIAALDSVYRVAPGLPALAQGESLIPSTDGHTLYRFDSRGKHLETIDAVTGVTELAFSYNSAGLLMSIRDKNGLTTKFERSRSGNVAAVVAPFGQRTTIELNKARQLAGLKDPLERKTTFEYGNLALLNKLVSPNGAEASFQYDAQGRLSKVVAPTGYFEEFRQKTSKGVLTVEATSAEGYLTSYALSGGAGATIQRSLTAPNKAKHKWNDNVTSQSSTAPDGTTVTTYFAADQAFGGQTLLPSDSVMRTPGGRTVEATFVETKKLDDPNNYLSASEWSTAAMVGDRVSETHYSRKTRTLTTTSPTGKTSTVTFDTLGRPVSAQTPGLASLQTEYDKQGRVISVTAKSGKETRKRTLAYDKNGWLGSVTNARRETSSFERDVMGRLLGVSLPDGSRTEQGYDDDDNLLFVTLPGKKTHDFLYQGATSQLVATLPPELPVTAGATLPVGETHYNYDKYRRLVGVERSDGKNTSVKYNSSTGQVETVTADGIKLNHFYDAFGRLQTLGRSDGTTVRLGYDGPLATSIEWSGNITGKITADYNDLLELKTITVNGSSSVSYKYDQDGAVIQTSGNGHTLALTRDLQTGFVTGTTLGKVETASGYNEFGESASLSARVFGKDAFSQTLTRDELGRVRTITEVVGGTTRSATYTYNSAGRLSEVDRNGVVTLYSYDANGNRTSVSVDGIETARGRYDAQDRILSYGNLTFEQSPHGDLVRRSDGTNALELTYDSLGNLLTAVAATPKTTKTFRYIVDGFGRRVGKQVDGKFNRAWLYRDALRPAAEINATGIFSHFAYADSSSAPDFMLRGGVPFRFIKDQLGSVRLVVNATTGAVAQALDYDEFGRVTRDTAPGFQPFGYAGGLYDPDTGLVRFGKRDYDAITGRWLTKDPTGLAGGANLYEYCGGDPLNYVDATGEVAPLILGVTAGGAFLMVFLADNDQAAQEAAVGQVLGLGLGHVVGKVAGAAGRMLFGPATRGAATEGAIILATKSATKTNVWGHSVVGAEVQGVRMFIHQVGGESARSPLLGGYATEVVTKEFTVGSYTFYRLPVSGSSAAAARGTMGTMLGPSGPYNILTNSCTTTCTTVLKEAGLRPPFWAKSPWLLQVWFKTLGATRL